MEKEILRVKIHIPDRILLNDRLIDWETYKNEISRLKNVSGVVWFYRDNPKGPSSNLADEAFRLIINHRLPISLSSQPDFSDYIDERGNSCKRNSGIVPA